MVYEAPNRDRLTQALMGVTGQPTDYDPNAMKDFRNQNENNDPWAILGNRWHPNEVRDPIATQWLTGGPGTQPLPQVNQYPTPMQPGGKGPLELPRPPLPTGPNPLVPADWDSTYGPPGKLPAGPNPLVPADWGSTYGPPGGKLPLELPRPGLGKSVPISGQPWRTPGKPAPSIAAAAPPFRPPVIKQPQLKPPSLQPMRRFGPPRGFSMGPR